MKIATETNSVTTGAIGSCAAKATISGNNITPINAKRGCNIYILSFNISKLLDIYNILIPLNFIDLHNSFLYIYSTYEVSQMYNIR